MLLAELGSVLLMTIVLYGVALLLLIVEVVSLKRKVARLEAALSGDIGETRASGA